MGRQVPQGAQRGPSQLEGAGQPGSAHGRPQQQREAELEDGQPHDDLQNELDRGLGGQNPIARFVGIEMVGDEMEGRVDGDGDSPGEPATDPAWDDERADHTPSGHDDQERTNHRRQVTTDNHGSASHVRTEPRRTRRNPDRPRSGVRHVMGVTVVVSRWLQTNPISCLTL